MTGKWLPAGGAKATSASSKAAGATWTASAPVQAAVSKAGRPPRTTSDGAHGPSPGRAKQKDWRQESPNCARPLASFTPNMFCSTCCCGNEVISGGKDRGELDPHGGEAGLKVPSQTDEHAAPPTKRADEALADDSGTQLPLEPLQKESFMGQMQRDAACVAPSLRCITVTLPAFLWQRNNALTTVTTVVEADSTRDGRDAQDRPWLPWPKFTQESPASASPASLSIISSTIESWDAIGKLPADVPLVELCQLSTECLPWLHAESMTALCQMLLNLAKTQEEINASRSFLHRLLRALAKTAQPCHGSDYVGLATELQLVGLAHGDRALRDRAEAFATTLRGFGDITTAAEVLWVFLTAKAVEMPLLEALGSLEGLDTNLSSNASNASLDALHAVAAILCGLAQPAVMSALGERLARLAEDFAAFLVANYKLARGETHLASLPAQTFPRLALALSDLLQRHGKCFAIAMPKTSLALEAVLSRAFQICQIFTMEELSDLAVASCSPSVRGCFLHHLIQELLDRCQPGFAPKLSRLVPGAAVQLRGVGSVPANCQGRQGLLGEFYLARGQWRVWLDGCVDDGVDSVDCVDVREDALELLDGGLRPKRCCHKCWRLSKHLSEDSSCKKCCDSGSTMISVELGQIPGLHDLPEGTISGRSAARLAAALLLSWEEKEGKSQACEHGQVSSLVGTLRRAAHELHLQSVSSCEGDLALLSDMRREIKRCGVRNARRFAATDGRHRVVRRSSRQPYLRDLTSFALRWDEARPAIGVAMTAEEERHFVGYVGSWLSHTRAVRQGLEEGAPFVVVLEDDQVLHPDMTNVLKDIITCAGDLLDVVILGPLDWRLRSLQYAQPRKIMQLTHPCEAGRSAEEVQMSELYGYKPQLKQEESYFLYSIGSRAMIGEDVLSTGCCGAWGYLVSRRGYQKMEASMKFMWESFDDVLQAELQGDNRFTEFLGRYRLWAVWPPLVTSDGKWPSQNSGEDLDFGKQLMPVSPHAGFRDYTLQTQVAELILGSDNLILHVAAASALLWPEVQPIWAYVIGSWRRLFSQRAGAGGDATQDVQRAALLRCRHRRFDLELDAAARSLPPGFSPAFTVHIGPPFELPPLAVRILRAPMEDLLWCPSAWFRDLLSAAPGTRISFHGPKDGVSSISPWHATELRQQLPRVNMPHISIAMEPNGGHQSEQSQLSPLGLAVVDHLDPELLELLMLELSQHPVLVTARQLHLLVELWKRLQLGPEKMLGSLWDHCVMQMVFLGRNPFASTLALPGTGGASPRPGCWARLQGLESKTELNGSEVLIVTADMEKGRWLVRLADGREILVRAERLETWAAALGRTLLEEFHDGSPSKNGVSFSSASINYKEGSEQACNSSGFLTARSLATTTAGTNPEFTVQIERAHGSSLGLNLDALDGQTLIISAIKMGPVRAYNEQQEDEDMMLQPYHASLHQLITLLRLYRFFLNFLIFLHYPHKLELLKVRAISSNSVWNPFRFKHDAIPQFFIPSHLISALRMSACQQESVEQACPAWCVSLEELRSEIKELRAEHMETKEQLLLYLQKLMDMMDLMDQVQKSRVGTGPAGSADSLVEASASPKSPNSPAGDPDDHHDRGQDHGDPQTSSFQPDLPGRVDSAIPDLCDLERMMLRSSQKTYKTLESSAGQHPVLPAIPQPKDEPPELPPAVQRFPSTGSLMRRRGSAFQRLARDSQAQILTQRARRGSVCKILADNIGVSLWMKWSNLSTFSIVMMSLCYLVPTVTLYILGLQLPGEQWTALSLMLFSTVAILLLHLVKRSLCSADLNMALQKLDSWWLRILQAVASCLLFAISSAVVMNGAYVQFNLLLGLGKTLDCWCADIVETQNFISGIQSWNSLQALLKCVGREITPCFTSLNLLGYVGFFVALAGSFSLLLDDGLEVWKVFLYESSLLPLLYLFYLSARLFAQGASLSERCRQIPAFVNQLSMLSDGADTDRQYLVRYISDSAAGFIVNGVTLSQSAFLRQMHFLAAAPTCYRQEKSLPKTLESIFSQTPPPSEVVVVDPGYSRVAATEDRTSEVAVECGAQVLASARGRAVQMNTGARATKAPVLLFLHADTDLPEGAIAAIQAALCDTRVMGGCFALRFHEEDQSWTLQLWSWFTRVEWCRSTRLVFGDRGIFVRRTAFEQLNGYRLGSQCLNSLRRRNGDSIVEVNGARGSSQGLLEHLKVDTELTVTLKRPVTFNISIARAYAPLGLQVEHAPNGTSLLVKTVNPGLIKDWNLSHRGMGIKRRDRVITVNGCQGNPAELMAKMKIAAVQGEKLDIEVCRY
eukprot:s28_g28.t2